MESYSAQHGGHHVLADVVQVAAHRADETLPLAPFFSLVRCGSSTARASFMARADKSTSG